MASQEFTTEELQNEIWKPVVGYECLYEVSSLGRIKSIRNHGLSYVGRILKGHVAAKSYRRLILCKQGITKCVPFHLVVAEAFIGPRPPGKVINHKDTVKTNNRADNLEYVTQAENIKHACESGVMPHGESVNSAKLTVGNVHKIVKLLDSGISQTRIAEIMGVSSTTICSIDLKQTWLSVPVVKNRKDRKAGPSGKRKLNEAQVREIKKRLIKSGDLLPLAKEFDVTPTAICDIKKGRTYAWVKV